MRRLVAAVLPLLLLVAACGDAGPVATINDIEIDEERLAALRPTDAEPLADDIARDLLLVILHDGLADAALSELGVATTDAAAEDFFEQRTRSAAAIGPLDAVLANRGVTTQRVRLEANLDALRDVVGPELVRAEAPGFDIDAAYEDFLLREGEVCVRQIELASREDYDAAVDRLDSGEPFAAVAMDMSTDPLVGAGEARAGGDLGCAPPRGLPLGLTARSLEATIGVPFGPVDLLTGAYLVLVYDRTLPELDSVRDEVREGAVDEQGEAVFQEWVFDVLRTADVTIDPGYGSWAPREGTGDVPTVIPANR